MARETFFFLAVPCRAAGVGLLQWEGGVLTGHRPTQNRGERACHTLAAQIPRPYCVSTFLTGTISIQHLAPPLFAIAKSLFNLSPLTQRTHSLSQFPKND